MYLFGSLWERWTMAFKVTTPMLHLLFMSAQLWGTWCFYKMYKRQCRIIAKKENTIGEDLEAGPKQEQDFPKSGLSIDVASRQNASRDGSEIELTERLEQVAL